MLRELAVVSDIVFFDMMKIRRLIWDKSEIKQNG